MAKFIKKMFLANDMRKDQIPKELSLTERIAQTDESVFDGDLGSYEPGDDGQDILGRNFRCDACGPFYRAQPGESPGVYRPTFGGRLIKEGTLRTENGMVISRSKNGWEFVIIRGIMVPRREYDAANLEGKLTSAIKQDSEEGKPEEAETPAQARMPAQVSYQKPKRLVKKSSPPVEYKPPKDKKRLHEPGRKVENVFGEPKSRTYYLTGDFKSVPGVVAALAGKPNGKYVATVNGKTRKFLIDSQNARSVRVYARRGIAEDVDSANDVDSYSTMRKIKIAREKRYNQKIMGRYSK